MKKYNPLTGTYGNYNIITHEWEHDFTGSGLFDVLSNIASKVTSDTAKELAKTTAKTALESASKKAGDELGKYAVEKIKDKVSRQPSDTSLPKVGRDLMIKELHKMNDKGSVRPEVASPRLYRGGINKIFKKYNIYKMFRTNMYCDRYEFVPFELDTPITIPGVGSLQKKTKYNFTINDKTSYHDWYKAYLKIRFKVVKMDNTNFAANERIAPISDAASLISQLKVSLNGKSLYDSISTYRTTNIKNLLNKSIDYTKINCY